MAFIEKRPDRNRQYRVRFRGPDGRERSRSFLRRSDAEKFAAVTESDKARGAWIDPRLSKETYGAWAKRWLESHHELKPKTYAGYDSLLRTHILPRWEHAALGNIEHLEVKDWVSGLRKSGLSTSRIRQAYRVFSGTMKAAVDGGYVGHSPCLGVKLPRMERREMLFLSTPEVDRLANIVPERYRALVYVLAFGGIRWGEAAALRRRSCDLLRGRLRIRESMAEVGAKRHFGPTKTHQTREVALPAFLRTMLSGHLDTFTGQQLDDLVFVAPKGGPLRHRDFYDDVWLPAVEKAKLPKGLRIHDLRHTCAALLIAEGANPQLSQIQLGHSTIAMTFDQYGHVFPDNLERIASSLDERWRAAQVVD